MGRTTGQSCDQKSAGSIPLNGDHCTDHTPLPLCEPVECASERDGQRQEAVSTQPPEIKIQHTSKEQKYFHNGNLECYRF